MALELMELGTPVSTATIGVPCRGGALGTAGPEDVMLLGNIALLAVFQVLASFETVSCVKILRGRPAPH